MEPEGEGASHRAAAGRHLGLQTSLVGQSEAMREVYEAIRRVSGSQATVLLRGESGTGKELVAKAIHAHGTRARGPFIRLHCAAMTESLLESELFGHERGAFTGAVEQRKGRFELADGGTLFLDEVGDIPPSVQVKLLRVLQDKCFERVGGSRLLSVDVRLVSATHRDLEAMVRAGTFREDLYYRLNVVPVTLPPLRERTGDIPLLIDHFLDRFNRENARHVRLGRDLMALMTQYEWPGNVRELQNCVERLVVMTEPRSDLVTLDSVPSSLRGYFADMERVTHGLGAAPRNAQGETLGQSLRDLEREQLKAALERSGWVQAKAARALGLSPRQVAYKVKKYRLVEASLRS
jgi:Nif-specific regulatory protein